MDDFVLILIVEHGRECWGVFRTCHCWCRVESCSRGRSSWVGIHCENYFFWSTHWVECKECKIVKCCWKIECCGDGSEGPIVFGARTFLIYSLPSLQWTLFSSWTKTKLLSALFASLDSLSLSSVWNCWLIEVLASQAKDSGAALWPRSGLLLATDELHNGQRSQREQRTCNTKIHLSWACQRGILPSSLNDQRPRFRKKSNLVKGSKFESSMVSGIRQAKLMKLTPIIHKDSSASFGSFRSEGLHLKSCS